MTSKNLLRVSLAAAALGTGCVAEQAEVKPTPVVVQEAPKPPPETSAEEHYNNGLKASQAKDYDTAATELGKAVAKKPDLASAHYVLAKARAAGVGQIIEF